MAFLTFYEIIKLIRIMRLDMGQDLFGDGALQLDGVVIDGHVVYILQYEGVTVFEAAGQRAAEKKACRWNSRRQASIFWADAMKFALISEVGFNATIVFQWFAIFYPFYFFYQSYLFLMMNTRPHTTHR